MDGLNRIVYFGDSSDDSQPESLGHHYKQVLMDAFSTLGYDAVYMDLGQSSEIIGKRLHELLDEGFLFGVGYSGTTYQKILEVKTSRGEVLYNRARAPYVSILVDPIFNYHNFGFSENGLNYLLLCMADETELKDISGIYPHVRQAFMTTGMSFVHESAREQAKPVRDRSYSIVYLGNYYSTLHRSWPTTSPQVADILNDIIDVLLADPMTPYISAARQVLSGRGMSVTEEWLFTFCRKYLDIPMLYIRGWSRREAVRALADAGFRIDVWGSSFSMFGLPSVGTWEDEKGICLHPPVSFKDMLAIMADAQMTLSVFVFPGGISERVCSGMLNGSVVLTDRSTYYDRNFVNGEDSLAFTWGKLDEFQRNVFELFKDKERMQCMANLGRQKILDFHMPIHLARSIVDQVEIYRELHGL